MKKIILLISTLLVALSFASCTSRTAEKPEDKTAEAIVYQKAQELGFDGSLEEFKKLCKGNDGRSVTDAYIEDGELVIAFSDGTELNLGAVVGPTGADGKDGVGIVKTEIDADGNLLIYYSDAPKAPVNLGKVVGADGVDGAAWLAGEAAPLSTLGRDGDWYFDASELKIYNKIDSEWVFVSSLEKEMTDSPDVTLTFDSDGGEAVAPVTAKQGESVDLPVAVKEGYIFLGWYYDDILFTDITPLSRDMTLVARWSSGILDIPEIEIPGTEAPDTEPPEPTPPKDDDSETEAPDTEPSTPSTPDADGPLVDDAPICISHVDRNGDEKCDSCDTDMPIGSESDDEKPSDKPSASVKNPILSAVSIRCGFYENQYAWNGAVTGTKETASAGSGVIYKLDKENGDAYIITNYHVVFNGNSTTGISDRIYVYLYGMEMMNSDGNTYAIPAAYVGGSMNYDIAVLKITGSEILKNSNAVEATVANSDEVSILDTAIAIGNPGAAGLSATSGCINVDSEEITVGFDTASGTVSVTLRVMRTDAAVNSGNSGGGLFNEKGELIGIVNAKDADDSVDNIGYAIPSNIARAIADNAI